MRKNISFWVITFTFSLFSLNTAFAQGADDRNTKEDFSPLQTAVPSLSIAPDARGGAMGDNGAATTPDMASQYWNPAKYAFQYSQSGLSLGYTPWLRKLVNDVALAYLSGFYKIGQNDNQAIGASLRYFSFGEIVDRTGNQVGGIGEIGMVYNPYEMAFDVSYSRKLSEAYSMAVALRYIRSDMNIQDDNSELTPGNAFAADIAGYVEKYVYLGNSESLWTFGFNISNIGTKISYDDGSTNLFLPTNLKIGTGLLYPLDDYNTLGVYFDINKYLVPTRPVQKIEESDEDFAKRQQDYNDMSPISGIFKSFTDANGGFSEELKEINLSLGLEYSYNDQFFLRGGYYHENKMKGNRQYFSFGAGFRMSIFQLDAAYLVSTAQNNPLDQTLRFSLSFDMDGIKDLFR